MDDDDIPDVKHKPLSSSGRHTQPGPSVRYAVRSSSHVLLHIRESCAHPYP